MCPQAVGPVHLIPWLDMISRIKCIQVRYGAIHTELGSGMRVVQYLRLHALRPCLHPPDLRKGAEETLVGRQPAEPYGVFSLGSSFKGRVGDGQASDICDIFTEGQVPVDMKSIYGDILVILLHDEVGFLLKAVGVFRRPPILQIPVRIILTTLVIESMRHFMADHQPDGAVIHGIVPVLEEEWWLQYARREINIVGRGIVIGVYSGWRHMPLGAVHRLADSVQA